MRSKVTYGLLLCVAISSMFAGSAVSMIVAAKTHEIGAAAETVLADWHMPFKEQSEDEIVTEKVEICLDDIANYIVEDQPDAVPGWTKARIWFYVTIRSHQSVSEVGVVAFFERYGTRSAHMLIPPSWIAVPSNGNLERELAADILRVLATEGGAR